MIDQTRITTNPLPSNWVGVTYFPKPRGAWHDDDTEEWTGEVLAEDDQSITLRVFGEPMTFAKTSAIVRRTA